MVRLLISEIFHSVQGEGLLAGTPSAFVRTTGCNLRCWFCDTPYTSWQPEGLWWALGDIVAEVERSGAARHVVLTGGEPMLQPGVVALSRELRGRGYHVTIETAATVDRPVECDLMSLSPKLANSTPGDAAPLGPASLDARSREQQRRWRPRHERQRLILGVIERLISRYDYQVKFVIDQPEDLEDVEAFLMRVRGIARDRVLLMPQALTAGELTAKRAWIEPHCAARGYRFGPRLHIELFGNRRGT